MGFGIDALVGWLPDDSGRDAMALAARFAASGEVTTRACTVLPQSWPVPSMAKVDAEYQRWLTEHGVAAVRAAETEMRRLGLRTGDPASFYVSNTAESAGLGEAAKQYDADIIVLGSAPGRQDRHVPGSTTDSLLHSSAVPLALAPVGTRNAVAPIERITCAYVGTSQSDDALSTATTLAAAWSVPLRLVAFAPRSSTTFPPLAGYRAEDVVSTRWTEQANGILTGALATLAVSHPHLRTESAVGVGNGWPAAVHSIPFTGADLLVVGSSRLGPIARVFLGSSASKIIRHAPVPTVVVPRGSSLHGKVTTMEEQ
ncbi:MAG: universal stress protein [Rhodococcus sp. (in: high G+C Gram-positive bacteria)]